MDCMKGMAQFPDKYFDLAIVDPPYGIGADKEKYTPENHTWEGKKRVGYAIKNWDKEVPHKEYFGELKRVSKNQIIWGGNYFGLVGGYIFWDKGETMPTYSKGELAWVSNINTVNKFEFLWSGYKKQVDEKRIHPTQKPVQLYKWLLHNYAKPDFKIIDTHAGSCSSVIAFLDYGCDWIAFEIDKDYYEAASNRIEIHKQQLKLF